MLCLAPLVLCLPLAGAPQDDPPIPPDTEMHETESGLRWCVLVPGTGTVHPKVEDRIKIHYRGWLTDGKSFDGTTDQPRTFALGQLIPGWQEGIPLMTEGAKYKFYIPWKLAYGEAGRPPVIPAKADLIFVVELLQIVAMPDFHAGVPEKQHTTESGLVWEVVRPGDGPTPGPDDVVELAFAVWTQDGRLLQCSEQGGRNLRGSIAQFPSAYLKEAVSLVPVGGRFRFEVPPSLFYPPGTPDAQRGTDNHVLEIELVQIVEPLPIPAFSRPDPDDLTTTASGLQYQVIEKSGSGIKPVAGQAVHVHYAGWLTNGVLFDNSYARAEPITFPLGRHNVIPGWDEGIALMEKGDVYKLVIPPALAYGERGSPPTIGPNETLIFLVELVGVGAD